MENENTINVRKVALKTLFEAQKSKTKDSNPEGLSESKDSEDDNKGKILLIPKPVRKIEPILSIGIYCLIQEKSLKK